MTNLRFVDSLNKTDEAVDVVLNGLRLGISSALVATDIGRARYSLGMFTGETTTDDMLGKIIAKCCIGKQDGQTVRPSYLTYKTTFR